MVNKDEYIM